jgi:hypothetical protein
MEHDYTSIWRRAARNVFAGCIGLLLGPSLLVWAVRAAALAAQCAPGPELCRGIALGVAERDTLSLAWTLGTNTWLLLGVAILAAIAGMIARRPLLGATALLLLPLAALMLPMAAVYSAAYPGCPLSESGVGDCMLWGAQMGPSVHTATNVPGLVYGFAPFSFALSLVLGIFGWFVARSRPAGHAHAQAPRTLHSTSFRVPDHRFSDRDY